MPGLPSVLLSQKCLSLGDLSGSSGEGKASPMLGGHGGAKGSRKPQTQIPVQLSHLQLATPGKTSKPQFPLLEKDSQCEHLTLQVSEGQLVGTHPQSVSGGSLNKCSSNFSLQGASFWLCDEPHSRDSLTISQVRKPRPWKARSLLRSQNRETQAPPGEGV